ncbi:MAG TPA: hypothetical protein VE978_00610 [Chitinophagales bacterium]|nr:hypothetical protein [Chitinophagales bacterium]
MEVVEGRITNLQQELMKLFSIKLSEQELLEIKELLSNYFAEKLTKQIDSQWKEKGWTNETMEQWLKEHHRTPYK